MWGCGWDTLGRQERSWKAGGWPGQRRDVKLQVMKMQGESRPGQPAFNAKTFQWQAANQPERPAVPQTRL